MTHNRFPIYPCCDHCEPEANGACWAANVGHGAYCLDCQSPESRITESAEEQPR